MSKHSRVFGLAFCLIFAGQARADQCNVPNYTNLVKPLLTGRVENGAREIRFEWYSVTYEKTGPWAIINSICNIGPSPLVVSWPMASLFTSAYSPLPPE